MADPVAKRDGLSPFGNETEVAYAASPAKVYSLCLRVVLYHQSILGSQTGSRMSNQMKLVTLCNAGSCCPVVRIKDNQVEIGEEGNLCVLTTEQWETLKEKIVKGEA
jgi:hypothetical protein